MDTCRIFEINTPERMAAFFAQLAHESMSLHYVEEIASGKAYEGRKDLGNTEPGDGVRFKGRGLIQITGRYNYQAFSDFIGDVDFVANPEKLEEPVYAALASGWYWMNRGLNEWADQNTKNSFRIICKKVNGGYNGYTDRVKNWEIAKAAFK